MDLSSDAAPLTSCEGPYTCMVNTDGTGQDWTTAKVTMNVPGQNSRSRAKATDFPLEAEVPLVLSVPELWQGQSISRNLSFCPIAPNPICTC